MSTEYSRMLNNLINGASILEVGIPGDPIVDDPRERYNQKIFLDQIMNTSTFDTRYADILKMYHGIHPYDREHGRSEIANKYKISPSRVYQIIDKAHIKLRRLAKPRDFYSKYKRKIF